MASFCSQCGKQLRFDGGVRTKRLERDMANKKIAGVCAGLANYLNVDVTLIRIILLTMVIAGGFGLLGYVIAWIAMPKSTLGSAPYALPPAA
ncbi:MAG: PspC domain-containing protein [Bryobacteraceae bacterium]|nr:PspC domain-containing protein [Bryobacteraceae bacterium]